MAITIQVNGVADQDLDGAVWSDHVEKIEIVTEDGEKTSWRVAEYAENGTAGVIDQTINIRLVGPDGELVAPDA